MKGFILEQISLLRSLRIPSDTAKAISWLFSLMISAYLLINLSIPLYESSTHKGYVFPTNEDGGRAIETSINTRWYNSNHFAPYGNLYYRFSHTLAELIPLETSGFTTAESKERSHHFSLKLVSLFSLYGLGLFFGWILLGNSFLSPLFASFFTAVTIHMPMFGKMIFRPHPDHLLNLGVAFALYCFAKLLSDKNNLRLFILSAFSWGFAMAIKRSTSIFIPGILILFLFPLSKENFKFTCKYIGYMLLAYLLIGFPQNFGFYKHIKFLIAESSVHSLGDTESMIKNLQLVWNQLVYLLPIVLLGSLFSINRQKIFSLKFLFFSLVAFVPILLRKVSFESDHHTMPLAISCTILIMVLVLEYLPWRVRSGLALSILLLIGIKFTGVSENYLGWKEDQINCSTDFDKITSMIEPDISPANTLVREASFPWNEKIGKFTKASWGLDWSMINSKVMFFGVTNYSLTQYQNNPPREMYGKMIERWDEKKKFYTDLKNKSSVVSPSGHKFQKIYSSKHCGHHLWKLAEND